MNLHISLSSLPSVAFSSHGLLPSLFGPSFKMLLKWPSYFASSFMSGFVFQLCSQNIKLLEQLQTRSHCSVYIIVIFLISHSVVHVKICIKGNLRQIYISSATTTRQSTGLSLLFRMVHGCFPCCICMHNDLSFAIQDLLLKTTGKNNHIWACQFIYLFLQSLVTYIFALSVLTVQKYTRASD